MATAAEPRPAELPLPGGRERAGVKVHPLLSGRISTPPGWLLLERRGRMAWRQGLGLGVPKDQWVPSPVVAFLVEHPGAGRILIDTGLHPSVAVKPRENLGRVSAVLFRGLEMEPDQAVSAQLRARGIQPAEIDVVVMTHLHPDHASAISEFPNATFVVSKAEWEAATSQGELHGYVRRQFDHGFDYRLLDFDDARAQGYAGFGRTFDLFGDGSVRAAFTPGHTLGHMSVILRAGERELLVAGDAIFLRRTLEEGTLPWRVEDAHLFRRSVREIQLYARSNPDAVIVPGHDWEAWQALQPSYG